MDDYKSFAARRPAAEGLPPFQMPPRMTPSSDTPSMASSSFALDPMGYYQPTLTPPDTEDNTSGAGDAMSPSLVGLHSQEQPQSSHGLPALAQSHYTFGTNGLTPNSNYSSTSSSHPRQQMPMSQYEQRPPMYSPASSAPATTYPLPSPTHSSPPSNLQHRILGSGPLPSTYGHPAHHGQPVMAPPQQYRQTGFYQAMPMNSAMLPNMHPHGGQIPMVQGNMHMAHGGMQQYMYPSQGQPGLERPFKCDVCTQCFSRNHDLKRHKRIHLSVKPYPCDYCGKQFSRKDALKRHRLVKGCDEKSKDRDKNAAATSNRDNEPPVSDGANGKGDRADDSPIDFNSPPT